MTAAPAFAHLPAAVHALLPELATLAWPDEPRADCARCPQAQPLPTGQASPWGFSPDTRCCTAHPSLANFLAGRALARGEPGRGRVLARLADPAGVSAWGIDPPPALDARYRDTIAEAFGRDVTLRCPFWVGGERSCGVWHDRSATCRTWFCKHEGGLAGAIAWSRVSFVLSEVEGRLARWAIEVGDPPAAPAPAAAWAAWYERAAALVERATEADLAPLVSDGLVRARGELAGFVAARDVAARRPVPARVVVAVSEVARAGALVLLTGYSSFDAVAAPETVFALLARLDGAAPWREALAAARAEVEAGGGDPSGLDAALVAALYRVGALRAADGADRLPYEVEMVPMTRWTRAAETIP